MPKKESRKLLATFNEQMEKLFDLLRVVEDIKLSPEVLEPDPVDIAGILSFMSGSTKLILIPGFLPYL